MFKFLKHKSTVIFFLLIPCLGFSQSVIKESQLVEKNKLMFFSDTPYTGKCFTNFEDGKTGIEGIYKNGKKNGEWIWYYENGNKKRSTIYIDGVKSGKSIYWYKTGKKKSEIIYDNDKNIRQLSWDEKGRPIENPTFQKF